jgi:5-methylcytosine-specific restriction endonuclease McrA
VTVPRSGLGLTRIQAAARARAAIQVTERVCETCPTAFSTKAPNRRYCETCAYGRVRDDYRKRTRDVAGYYRSVRAFPIHELGDRDRWTCHLCGTGVDPRLRNRHPGMASYDHVIPSSRGGSDERDNLKLAHLICNSRRRASDVSALGYSGAHGIL